MSFLVFVYRNLARQRVRTVLTVLGIAVGITTVVALGSVAAGLRQTAGSMLKTAGADFVVAQKGSADLTFSALSAEDRAAVERREDVERAIGLLMDVSKVGSNPYFALLGVEPEQLVLAPPRLEQGRLLQAGHPAEALLGVKAARDLGARSGSRVLIHGRSFTVVGVYHGDNPFFDAGAYAPLATVQAVARKPGLVTALFVKAAAGSDPRVVAKAIESEHAGLTTVSSVDEYGKVDQGIQAIDAANLAISVLAVVIGAIGVMNTMIMSVFERTREIGILRAVGWRGSRILRMILGESLVLCSVAAAAGTLLGVGVTRLVVQLPDVGPFLTPAYPVSLFVRAVVIALAVALAGALYPALRAIRFSPMEALRHE
jgi:putative ABC transport system permease protein